MFFHQNIVLHPPDEGWFTFFDEKMDKESDREIGTDRIEPEKSIFKTQKWEWHKEWRLGKCCRKPSQCILGSGFSPYFFDRRKEYDDINDDHEDNRFPQSKEIHSEDYQEGQ